MLIDVTMTKIECIAREKSGVSYITLSPATQRLTTRMSLNLLDGLLIVTFLVVAAGLLIVFVK
jgi:hypothetical protein